MYYKSLPVKKMAATGRANTLLIGLCLLGLAFVSAFWILHERGEADSPVHMMQSAMQEVPLPGPKEKLRFVAMGDWGAGSPMQFDVARQMAATFEKNPFVGVILLGDNIYPRGEIFEHADAYFNKPYGPLLAKGVQFYPVLGNHDVLFGHGDEQVRFFKMPGRYYLQSIGPIDFFMLDSNTFYKEEVQQAWLKKALRDSQADWKIVVGHHPLYTSGEHQGEGAIAKLRTTLQPILEAEGADLYLAGHDHEYERFEPMGGVTYIVSGGGGAYLRDFKNVLPHSLKRVKANHFMLFTLDGEQLGFKVIDKTGTEIDRGNIEHNPVEQSLKKAS